jgi:hypothetical protein
MPVKSFITSATGGSMVPRYVLQLLYNKNHKIAKNSTSAKAREMISTNLESLAF